TVPWSEWRTPRSRQTCAGSAWAAYFRIADAGATTTSCECLRIVMSESAKPSDSALVSSASLRKTNGSTATDVRACDVERLDVDASADRVVSASSTASACGYRSAGCLR